MDYINIHKDTGLLICKECKFALIPSRVDSHFRGKPHRLTPTIRSQIKDYISQLDISNLINSENEIKSNIKTFLQSFNSTSFIPELAIYENGLACPQCSYISLSTRSIKNHLKDYHDWANIRGRGRKKRSNEDDPWTTNVPCQHFFKSHPGNEYFRVNINRASPINIPTRPRIEISRERESTSSENSQDQEEDLNLLRPLSQGKLYILFITFIYIFFLEFLAN